MNNKQKATIELICGLVKLKGYNDEQCNHIKKVFAERKLDTQYGDLVFPAIAGIESYLSRCFILALENTSDKTVKSKLENIINATSCLSYIEAIFEFLEAVD